LTLKLYTQYPINHHEHFIFMLVRMPNKLSAELSNFDQLIINTPHNQRLPKLLYSIQLLLNIDSSDGEGHMFSPLGSRLGI